MVTNELCIALCFILFLFGMACGIVIGIKAEDRQRHNERDMQKMSIDFDAYEKFIGSDSE